MKDEIIYKNNIMSLRRLLHGQYFEYDINKYPFKSTIEKSMGIQLENIHHMLGEFKVFNREQDQMTLAHKVYYANYARDLNMIYESFIQEEIRKIIPYDFYYQRIPTFRLGLPGNRFVGEYHTDRKYNHGSHEINFNLGLSNYIGNNALRVQESPDSNKYIQLECIYGKIFSFDHIDCLHGAELNNTEQTMASIDFRISLVDLYEETGASSINLKMPLTPGQYFSKKIISSKQ